VLLAALAVVMLVVLLAGSVAAVTRLPQSLLQGQTASASASSGGEPDAAHLFTQALERFDPVAMRAQVTPTCINDNKSNLCFGPESDPQFKAAMSGHSISITFLNRYQAFGGTVVLYDMLIRNQSTGHRDDLILILRLARSGKIDHALVS
jgi:hypothetical protein